MYDDPIEKKGRTLQVYLYMLEPVGVREIQDTEGSEFLKPKLPSR